MGSNYNMHAENRIRKEIEKWFIVEPLLFSVWLTHKMSQNPNIRNIRVGHGRIEYNPEFIQSLSKEMLQEVLLAEAMRIVLKHPYTRRKDNPLIAYKASNITLKEYLSTQLDIPSAKEVFHSDSLDKQYFELYYTKLMEQQEEAQSMSSASGSGGQSSESDNEQTGSGGQSSESDSEQTDRQSESDPNDQQDRETDSDSDDHRQDSKSMGQDDPQQSDNAGQNQNSLSHYTNENKSGIENTLHWDRDEFQVSTINDRIRIAHQTNSWGNQAGYISEVILATLIPEINYKKILRHFRASILSNRRILTRMKPSRRYGFQYMGSKYDFSTRLLFAVDVSASMTTKDLRKGFTIINQIFKYGIESVDVIQFDTIIRGKVMTLKKAQKKAAIIGRGGTCFSEVIAYIDTHTMYDGLIIYTDGYADTPPKPANKKTKIVWLFCTKNSYDLMKKPLSDIGKAAYIN
ncbi:MAG: hypothetical protein OMM_01134 [Candidatus Magnetoglobus multicellularis str. Araruama]|uniref:VWA-like domain-containing protein n=1 Tax=Candidatus Magnetoglobus multicellularis str. Araruama TaxID=890399 RepID=A0A1V1PEU4_9BACT|nr:MAG: hypothetical protein OMM_01134 [Candidatus Magnetoglobus multicellularis str. Araruama]